MGIVFIPPIFPRKMAKEENMNFLRGHNSWNYQFFDAQFFGVTPHVLYFQKNIMGKISHGGWKRGPIDYVLFEKNRFKISFLLYKSM